MTDYRPAVARLPEGGMTGIQLLCLDCGAAVADTGRHDDFHAELARLGVVFGKGQVRAPRKKAS